MPFLRSSLTYVWLFLVLTTLVSWWLGVSGSAFGVVVPALSSGFVVTISIFLIAVVKTRFVIWHFMEVRHGPLWLRLTCDAWLACLTVTLLALYGYNY